MGSTSPSSRPLGLGQLAYNNFGMTPAIAVETNPASADVAGGGVKLNVIPKEGGNALTGDLYFSGMNGSWQADNITQELRDKGLRTPEGTEWMYDMNPGVGGPIVRDKLWFYVSGRLNKAKLAPAGGAFFDPDPATGNLVPGDRQGFNDTATDNISFRVTWQASQNNKIATYRDQWWRYQSHFGGRALQDWATVPRIYNRGEQYIWPTKWTNTASNRVLIEGAFQYYGFDHTIFFPQPGVLQDRPSLGLSPDQQTGPWYAGASRRDLVLGTTTHGSGDNCCTRYQMPSYVISGSVSYVTGSHTFKAGGQMFWGYQDVSWEENNASLQQRYRNGVPDSVNVGALPSLNGADINRDLGFLCAGSVDDRSADGQRRGPVRTAQVGNPGHLGGGGTLCADKVAVGARCVRLRGRAAPLQPGLRPVRRRADRAQGQRRQVRADHECERDPAQLQPADQSWRGAELVRLRLDSGYLGVLRPQSPWSQRR